MNKILKYILYILPSVLIGYLIGSLFPSSIFSFLIDETIATSKGESFYYLICFMQVIMMIITALLAVFGDTVRQLLRHPSLSAELRSNQVKEELVDPKAQQKKAKRYYNIIDIHNTGKQNASDCELILERIVCTQGNEENELLADELEKEFIGGKNYISVNGKKSILLYELLAAEEQGQTKGIIEQPQPQLIICGVAIPPQYSNGKLTIFIKLNTFSTEAMPIKAELTWDGIWENRSFDMDKHLKSVIVNG